MRNKESHFQPLNIVKCYTLTHNRDQNCNHAKNDPLCISNPYEKMLLGIFALSLIITDPIRYYKVRNYWVLSR